MTKAAIVIQVGDLVGRLTIVEEIWIPVYGGRKRGWLCACACGKEEIVKHAHVLRKPLLRGEHSCGCAQVGVPRGAAPGKQRNNGKRQVPDPSEDEIWNVLTLEIREEWSDEERERRMGVKTELWEVPIARRASYKDHTGEFS